MIRLETVKNRCNTLAKIVGIFEGICTALACITGGIALTFMIGASYFNPILKEAISQGSINYNVTFNVGGVMGFEKLLPPDNYSLGIGLTCLFATIAIIFLVVILAFIKKIFTIIKEENSPFSDKCLKTIKVSFIVITASTFLGGSLGVTLLTGFILFCIYSVFEYGAALQNEIDETL
jgi:hypothetical protein